MSIACYHGNPGKIYMYHIYFIFVYCVIQLFWMSRVLDVYKHIIQGCVEDYCIHINAGFEYTLITVVLTQQCCLLGCTSLCHVQSLLTNSVDVLHYGMGCCRQNLPLCQHHATTADGVTLYRCTIKMYPCYKIIYLVVARFLCCIVLYPDHI